MDQLSNYSDMVINLLLIYVPIIIKAALILTIGFWIVKKVNIIFQATLGKANFAPEITSFLGSLVDMVLKVFVLLIVASTLGFELTSLVAVLAAAGFAVGLALQGSLGNFAAGITIMVFKPYRVGQWVEIQEKFGMVESIQIFNTTIVTPGKKTHIIPNGQVVEGVITNFSNHEYIRLELQITMPYEESYPKVQKVIKEALSDVSVVLAHPEPEIGIESYDSHSIIVAVRPFIKPENYWDATFQCYAKIKEAFNNNGIKVAYSEGVELGTIGN